MKQKRLVNPGDLILKPGHQIEDRFREEGTTDSAMFGSTERSRTCRHNYMEHLAATGQLPKGGPEDSQMYDQLLEPRLVRRYKPAVSVSDTAAQMGATAASFVASQMKKFIAEQGRVVMNLAAAPSQDEFYAELLKQEGIDWSKVVIVHLDEYNLPPNDPHSFRMYLKGHIVDEAVKKGLKKQNVHFIADTPGRTMEEKCANYAKKLGEIGQVDIACIGVGENGHIGFNDPPVADFNDPFFMKVVAMDERCRRQQLRDYRRTPYDYGSIDNVPKAAMTMTVPGIISAKVISVVAKGPQKADAIKGAVEGNISTDCPASILGTRDKVYFFLERDSASKLKAA